MHSQPELILASSSITRRALFDRLHYPYRTVSPDFDETLQPQESPEAACLRLAIGKARAVATANPGAVVVGSDQLVASGDSILGKPLTREGARAQLRALSGRIAVFHVAVAVIDAQGQCHSQQTRTEAHFRALDEASIEHYLDLETPWHCAGSMKSEGLGLALLDTMPAQDPTAILGLPLIATLALLRQAGIDPLKPGAPRPA
ncbi:Maf family protein [Halothiobacillus sp. DCM-1]|uniref:Maf family protein n=1 Tax=Halothiobacillus sp. DCM-1 TaxID=3112558 RepID=UPI0032518502